MTVFHIIFSAYNFLETFNQVARDNNFFDPSFSLSDMDDLPGLYRTIIDDPASLHDSFMKAKGEKDKQ